VLAALAVAVAMVMPLGAQCGSSDLAVVPLRDMRTGQDFTPLGIGLARYLERDIRLLRESESILSRDPARLCLAEITTINPKQISSRELRKLALCLDTKELVWGTFGAYESRVTVYLDHWLARSNAYHRYEGSGSREKAFETIDRLVLNLAEQFGWPVSQEKKQALEKRETDSFPAYLSYWEGRGNYARGEHEAALEKFQEALEEDPGFTWARLFVGNCYVQMGTMEAADPVFRSMTEEDPGFVPAFVNLGVTLMARGQKRAAIHTYKKVKDWDQYPPLLFNMGNAYRALEQDTETLDAYETAIRLAPDFAEAYYQLGIFYKSRDGVGKAREYFLRARWLRPELRFEVFDLGLPFKDILIEDPESYEAELATDAVLLVFPGEETE
jgi:tetratricopeptide (TPR) repeat protein